MRPGSLLKTPLAKRPSPGARESTGGPDIHITTCRPLYLCIAPPPPAPLPSLAASPSTLAPAGPGHVPPPPPTLPPTHRRTHALPQAHARTHAQPTSVADVPSPATTTQPCLPCTGSSPAGLQAALPNSRPGQPLRRAPPHAATLLPRPHPPLPTTTTRVHAHAHAQPGGRTAFTPASHVAPPHPHPQCSRRRAPTSLQRCEAQHPRPAVIITAYYCTTLPTWQRAHSPAHARPGHGHDAGTTQSIQAGAQTSGGVQLPPNGSKHVRLVLHALHPPPPTQCSTIRLLLRLARSASCPRQY